MKAWETTFRMPNVFCSSGLIGVVNGAATIGQGLSPCSMILTYPNLVYVMISKYLYAVCEANNIEKPGAVIPHAGICEGAAG